MVFSFSTEPPPMKPPLVSSSSRQSIELDLSWVSCDLEKNPLLQEKFTLLGLEETHFCFCFCAASFFFSPIASCLPPFFPPFLPMPVRPGPLSPLQHRFFPLHKTPFYRGIRELSLLLLFHFYFLGHSIFFQSPFHMAKPRLRRGLSSFFFSTIYRSFLFPFS